MVARESDQFTNIRLGLGKRDSLWHFAINGCIGRIERPHGGVEMEVAFQIRTQALQVGGACSRHVFIHTPPGWWRRLESRTPAKSHEKRSRLQDGEDAIE